MFLASCKSQDKHSENAASVCKQDCVSLLDFFFLSNVTVDTREPDEQLHCILHGLLEGPTHGFYPSYDVDAGRPAATKVSQNVAGMLWR